MTKSPARTTPNNFDLLRLAAAVQVMLGHIERLLPEHYRALDALRFFPGVPLFFFISGFLISASWERNPRLGTYARNRVLRIFPGLWLVFFFTLLVLLLSDRALQPGREFGHLLAWAVAQLSFLQDWHPAFLAGYGIEGTNGSLWTLPVEMCFYAAVPLLYWFFARTGRADAILLFIIVASFAIQSFNFDYAAHVPRLRHLYYYTNSSPVPWIGMFCCGMLAQRHLARLLPLVAGRLWLFSIAYLLIAAATAVHPVAGVLGIQLNHMEPVNFIAFVLLILSAAYSKPRLADRLLKRNDISYGIYLCHWPLMNLAVFLGLAGGAGFWFVILAATALAALSWTFVERPALSLRTRALYRRTADAPA